MQAVIGTRPSLQQGKGGYLGQLFLGTMMMRHLSGRLNGFRLPEFHNFNALQQLPRVQVTIKLEFEDDHDRSLLFRANLC